MSATAMKGCYIVFCSGIPEVGRLCLKHQNEWLSSPERIRRARLKQLGAPASAVERTFLDFILQVEAKERITREPNLRGAS